jgi:hypothetical protein
MSKFMKLCIGLLLMIFSDTVLAKPFDTILGKEIIVSDTWAGQSFTLTADENKSLSVSHKILGSGVAVVSEKKYPVEKSSEYKIRFFIETDKYKNEFILICSVSGELKIFVNDYELKGYELKRL